MDSSTAPEVSSRPYFPIHNKIARVLWSVAYTVCFRPSPRPFHAWRRLVLRLFGATIGKECHIYSGAQIWAPWNLVCEEGACIGDGAILYNQAAIILGKKSIISQGAHLCTGSHDYESPEFELVTEPIYVGAYAWIAAECFIHAGVKIGEGAVVGARSVVIKDIPEWTVSSGNPCVPIKARKMRPSKKRTDLQ